MCRSRHAPHVARTARNHAGHVQGCELSHCGFVPMVGVPATARILSGETLRDARPKTFRGVIALKAIHRKFSIAATIHAATILVGANGAAAETAPAISITTPDKIETRLGLLEFKDGAPSKETAEKIYDSLDLMHASEAFLNAFRGASLVAARKGFMAAGADDNTILLFSELMDSQSLFLTANVDTIYYFGFLDLTKGPLVVETPPLTLGAFDDMWFRWITDFGLPGPDRGAGGSTCWCRRRTRVPTAATTWRGRARRGSYFSVGTSSRTTIRRGRLG